MAENHLTVACTIGLMELPVEALFAVEQHGPAPEFRILAVRFESGNPVPEELWQSHTELLLAYALQEYRRAA